MFKRDDNGLKTAKRNNARYVCAKLETGKIIGCFSYISNAIWIGGKLEGIETFTIEEYEWLTDETRYRTVTTAGDLYDKIEWTSKGFKIDGEKVPIN